MAVVSHSGEEFAKRFPEHTKLKAHAERRDVAQEFYDFLLNDKGLHFGKYHQHTDDCYGPDDPGGWGKPLQCGLSKTYLNSVHIPPEDLLAEFLGIDRNKLEEEKRAMLEDLRKANETRATT